MPDVRPLHVDSDGNRREIEEGALIAEDLIPLDSGEHEYTPGLVASLLSSSGDTVVFTPAAGNAFRLRWAYAVPVLRGTEEAPVITVKLQDSGGADLQTLYVAAALSKRKLITAPADARLVVALDIGARVPCTFDIEEFTP